MNILYTIALALILTSPSYSAQIEPQKTTSTSRRLQIHNSFDLFINAIRENDLEQVKEHLHRYPTDINKKTRLGHSPISIARELNYSDMLKLLTAPSSLTHEHFRNLSPALSAAYSNNQIIPLSLTMGEEQHYEIKENSANEEKRVSTLEEQLLINAQVGNLAKVKSLISQGVNINTQDNEGNTPLMQAAKNGHETIIENLLDAGANKEAINNKGITALGLAASAGRRQVAALLINKGADVNHTDNAGFTPLIYAASKDSEIIDLLLKAGADITHRNYLGKNAYEEAIEKGHYDIAKFIAEKNKICKKTSDKEIQEATQLIPDLTSIVTQYTHNLS